jgi:hypothetical protein
VILSKFHSAFVTSDGNVYTCGHGRGGRLGHGQDEFQLVPKIVKSLQEHKICQVSLGIDHSLFLSTNGLVFACGHSNYDQLGMKDQPTLLNSAKTKLPSAAVGVAASKFHSLFWTKNQLYTWGLNGGQLGHMNTDRTISAPKLVSTFKNVDIQSVCSCDGAIVVLTKAGDLMALNEYQTRRVASRLLNVVKIEAIGGHLDPKAISKNLLLVERGGQDLKIFVLNNIGKISVWQEKSPTLTLCVFNVSRELWITDLAVHRGGLLLISMEGSAYEGIHQSKSAAPGSGNKSDTSGGSLFRFIDKESCDLIKVKRVPFIHRGVKATVDPKGNNFCVLQSRPNSELVDLPIVNERTLAKEVKALYDDDTLKDLEMTLGSKSFRCHKFILASLNDKLANLIDEEHQGTSVAVPMDSITESPELFEQILQYAYYQSCDLMTDGLSGFTMHPTINGNNAMFTIEEANESAHQVYNKQKSSSKTKKHGNDSRNPIILLQDLAKSLGLHNLFKALESYSFNMASNTVKKKKDSNCYTKTWSRTRFPNFSDVIITTDDKVKFIAHKCILSARLDYFRSMFSAGWVEAASDHQTHLNLPLDSKLCKVLLDFIYTDFDQIGSDDPEFLCNVMVMADQLLIPRLIQICEKELTSLLTLKNVGEILQLASDFNAEQLKTACMSYVCYNVSALLESKGLDVVDVQVLADVSKHYKSNNSAFSSRVVTPYSIGPTTDEIERHAIDTDISPEDIFNYESEVVNKSEELPVGTTSSSSKKKKRIRRVSTESTGSSVTSDSENELLNRSSETEGHWEVFEDDDFLDDIEQLTLRDHLEKMTPFTIKASKKDELESKKLIQSFFNDPKKFSASNPSSSSIRSSEPVKKFNKMSQKERKKLLNNGNVAVVSPDPEKPKWNGWGPKIEPEPALAAAAAAAAAPAAATSLALIMKAEAKDVKIKTTTTTPNKRTRKQSWTSLSFGEEANSSLAQSPPTATPNPWKIRPQPAMVEDLGLIDILQEEVIQSQKLTRAQSKSLFVTQTEEKAIADLKAFYNVDNVFDEYITVDRVDQRVLATPFWNRKKS